MSATTANPASAESFFNLHASGIGYLNRIRWVEPSRKAGRRAEPFLACAVSAMRGRVGDGESTYFDLRVSGEEAKGMIEALTKDVDAHRKVVISFRIGDFYPHVYERDVRDQSGRKTGEKEWTSLIKGRLLLINSITIDGERVYTREREDDVPPVGRDDDDDNMHIAGSSGEQVLMEGPVPEQQRDSRVTAGRQRPPQERAPVHRREQQDQAPRRRLPVPA